MGQRQKAFFGSAASTHAAFVAAVVVAFLLRLFIGGLSAELAAARSDDHPRGAVSLNLEYSKPCAFASVDGGGSSDSTHHMCSDCPLCFGRAEDSALAPILAPARDAAQPLFALAVAARFHPQRWDASVKPVGWNSSWSSRGSPHAR